MEIYESRLYRGDISVAKHPLEPDQAMHFRRLLRARTANIQSGEWRVDLNGKSEPATKFELQDANADR
jgi:hypothetical protein